MTEALIVTDGRSGNLRQARALARAAHIVAGEVQTDLRAPWTQLAPRMARMGALAQRNGAQLPSGPPWPKLVIGCGRQAAWVTRWLRRHADNASYCVQILNPRINSRHWDLLIAPQHDAVRGDNVLRPVGSLNPVDSAWLAKGRSDFEFLARLPQPRVAVLLGGPRRGVIFDTALQQALVHGVKRQLEAGGSALLCASPRTPPDFARAVRDALVPDQAWLGEADGDNPYAGHLAWADRIVVTPDSVNMLSEAAATGAPVHTVSDSGLPDRLQAFHRALRQGGWLHDLDQVATGTAAPLRETREVADEVLRRMQAHFARARVD